MSHPKGDTCYEVSPDKTVRASYSQGYVTGYAHGKAEALPSLPPFGYAPCSPELLESGVDCATAPRWSSPTPEGHSHWHPVPPAGDVEVLARVFFHALHEENDYEVHDEKDISGECECCIPALIVDRAHVTRLTAERDAAIKAATLGAENLNKALETADGLRAERDALKAEVERHEQELDSWANYDTKQLKVIHGLNDQVSSLQSELTKARECISEIRTESVNGTPYNIQLIADAYLVHQSAPAAKGDSDEA